MAELLLNSEVENITNQTVGGQFRFNPSRHVEGLTAAQNARLSVSKAKRVRSDRKSEWLPLQAGRCCDETSLGTDGAKEFNSVRQENEMPGSILTTVLTWQ